MTAQFKEMEQEMEAESEQSGLYIHLGQAWENPAAPCVCLLQAGRQVDLQVLYIALLRLRDTPDSVICREKLNNIPCISTRAEG